MRALTLLSLVAGFTLLPAGAVHARTSKSPRCKHRAHERVVAQSARVRMLMEGNERLTACSLQTGRRRGIDPTIGSWPGRFSFVRLHGTTLVYALGVSLDRYLNSMFSLYRDDALHPRREEITSAPISAASVGPGRTVAFVYPGGGGPPQLHVNRPSGALREHRIIDSGRRLTRLAFSGTRLTWQRNGVPRSHATALPDRCHLAAPGANGAPPYRLGTELIDYIFTGAGYVVCWRATGATYTTDNLGDAELRDADASGAWFATSTADGRVTTVNAETGRREAIPAPNAREVAINSHGSVAWLVPSASPGDFQTAVWAHDADGTRLLDLGNSFAGWGFDGSTLIWGLRSAELRP